MNKKRITGIVIAGGKSLRMGKNKAIVEYKGKRLVDNAICILQNHTQNILISSNKIIDNILLATIPDKYKNVGPISGLYSCLKASTTELNIVIPCDVPNLNYELYNTLIENSNGFDAVVPRLPNGKLEPLIGCYKKNVLPIIENQINQNDYKLVNLLLKIETKYIDITDIEQFKNINTPNDLE